MPIESENKLALSTFASNLAAVIRYSRLSVNAWSKKYQLTQTTVNRIVTGRMDPTTRQVEEIAKRIGLSAWQMMAPNLDPQNPPVMREANPEERDLYQRLKRTIAELEELRESGNTRPAGLDEPTMEGAENVTAIPQKPSRVARPVSGGLRGLKAKQAEPEKKGGAR